MSIRLTADGVIGTSGKPIRVLSVEALAGSGGVGELVLRDGTSDSGTIYVQQNGTLLSHSDTFNWTGGLYFPNGCFWDKDDDTDAIVINYEQVTST